MQPDVQVRTSSRDTETGGQDRFDIVIAGGGMVGATLALALRDAGLGIALVEPVAPGGAAQPSYDDRGIALSLASERVLRHIGTWDRIAARATPIRGVHVTEAGRFGCVRMAADRLGLPALGHVVVARALGAALWEAVRAAPHVTLLCPDAATGARVHGDAVEVRCRTRTLTCRLLVIADGVDSTLRPQLHIAATEHDYGQCAIVANVTTALPHDGTAYERFGEHGPLALLPLEERRMVSVNCVAAAAAPGWLALDDATYCARLGARMGGRLGGFTHCGARRMYPLRRVVPERQVDTRTVLLGSAALNIHPNGAQGFNVALRDVAGLAELLHGCVDPGAPELLQRFAVERAGDRERVMQFSHGLARMYASRNPAVAALRQAGLLLTEFLPALKKDMMVFGAGLHGRQPACVRSVA